MVVVTEVMVKDCAGRVAVETDIEVDITVTTAGIAVVVTNWVLAGRV